ncbi:MAG TPA: SDR family oxidoreductase, partial [Rubrobacter sp.]|nr:SDR family oxidoreductase [Rubrobacter sp.]
MLGEAYEGKRILLTGGTGFLGTALVEKILRSLPDIGRLYLVIRPHRGKSAAERFERDVLGAAAFRGLRERLGDDFADHVSKRVRVLEGDVHAPSLGLGEEDLAELSREVDVVIHSAASVIFDAPLDAAVDSNVRGTLGLMKLARAWEKRPLFIHISTAYVAGTGKEDAPEAPPGPSSPDGTTLDAREEVLGLEAVVAEVD